MSSTASVEIDRSTRHPVRRTSLWLSRAVSFVVYAYVVVVEIVLLLGFVLLLFGANPSSPFVEWVYRSLDRAMRPFRGIFEPVELGVTQADVPAILETSVLFAMIVYAILAIVVHAVLEWFDGRLARLDRVDEEYRHEQLVRQAMATQPPPGGPAAPPAPAAPAPPPPGS